MPTAEAVDHKVVSHQEWVQARRAFLVREKEFTQAREAMAEKLRAALGESGDGVRL